MNEPAPRTIKKVVEYLESIGLAVYGGYTSLETGAQYAGCMDYDADAVLKYRRLHRANKLHRANTDD